MLSQKDVDTLLIEIIGEGFHRKCGFCGSEDTKPIHVVTINDCAIVCNKCKAQGPIAETVDKAWVKWNIRAEQLEKEAEMLATFCTDLCPNVPYHVNCQSCETCPGGIDCKDSDKHEAWREAARKYVEDKYERK